eukprot:3562473-Karenia_brevis.AAC.1
MLCAANAQLASAVQGLEIRIRSSSAAGQAADKTQTATDELSLWGERLDGLFGSVAEESSKAKQKLE